MLWYRHRKEEKKKVEQNRWNLQEEKKNLKKKRKTDVMNKNRK